MPITNRHTEKKYVIESLSTSRQTINEELVYDQRSEQVTLHSVQSGTPWHYWMSYNVFQKIAGNTSTGGAIIYNGNTLSNYDVLSINSALYGDRIKPSSFQFHLANVNNPYVLRVNDWNKDQLGPVFAITGSDSLMGSLSSGVAGTTTTGITVDILFRPYPSENERCLFHRWTSFSGSVYSEFIGSPSVTYDRSVDYHNWGIGSFFGEDNKGTYIDFFVYGKNYEVITGSLTAVEPLTEDVYGTTAEGSVAIISAGQQTSNTAVSVYRFAFTNLYDIEGAPWPIKYSASAYSGINGTIGGDIDYVIYDGASGSFTGYFYYNFYNNNTGRIANTIDTRYYIPPSINIYDGDFHRVQCLWDIDALRSGEVFLDGEQLTNKEQYGDGRVSAIDYDLTGSACATPLSIFGFIEANNVGNIGAYEYSYHSAFGELAKFIMFDRALHNMASNDPYKTLKLLSGQTVIDGNRYFHDALTGYTYTTSAQVNAQLQSEYSAYVSQYKKNVVLYFDTSTYTSGDTLTDLAVTQGFQIAPATGHIGKIYQAGIEGKFEHVSDMIFDIDTSSYCHIPSSLDWTITSNENSIIVKEPALSRLYKRDGIYISNFGSGENYESYNEVGFLNYNTGLAYIQSGIINQNMNDTSTILVAQTNAYRNGLEIDIEGEFFTRSENESGWYQESIGDIRPKSPTKYVTGIVIYDEDGDPMIIGKFPMPVKKTIYDDMRIRIDL